ncbi:fructosamine kinase [Seonamhaeicola sp. S2-3]|uniref:fructosamine kinase family protein n=1 Tax=Seonamhaeicola sp. S2-3 TaxID=1936081 RepID=UPI000972B47B|nr:fructosamine kinase family protein [Seonamhaeicola sp. S2-3]APY11741.1 fructosamine kinase [Seonamhaeicola sp. S2-3]
MLSQDFKTHIEDQISEKIQTIKPVSGGDISEAYVITTKSQNYFIKINTSDKLSMFKEEVNGLKAIANTKTIATPKIYQYGTFNNKSFVLMAWIDTKTPTSKDLKTLGTQLANLHKSTATHFGFKNDNFIGSLPQSNKKHQNWTNFYVEERLQPQLKLAKSKQLLNPAEIPSTNQLKNILKPLFTDVKPSLLHGDLWSGNYIIASNGTPYLIDPAVYYGHNEVDIAMTKLFGGFSNDFYNAYFKIFPANSNTNQRIEIYQLYYLLVHLNLFGSSYYGSVKSILKKHF